MCSLNPIDRLTNISVYDYYKFYIRNSRLLGMVWQVLTICFAICLLLIFASTNWIGDSLNSSNRGYFGLYSFCTRNQLGTAYNCFGTWTDFSTLPNSTALKLACALVGIAFLLIILCLLISIFAIIVKYERIFHICAWIQLLTTICLVIGVCIYPISWNIPVIRSVCGDQSGQYELGTCSLRWPFILACLASVQIIFLTMLAFLLAARQAKFILIHGSSKNLNSGNEFRTNERTYLA